jgi:hypothetical protein
MAFPTIQTADTKPGTQASNSSSWTLTYPTNLASGDLILAFLAADGSSGLISSMPAGWLFGSVGGTANGLSWAKKLSAGTETGTFSVGLSASEQGGWRIFRITGWSGTLGTTFNSGIGASEGDVRVSTNTGGSDANPDSGNLAGWSGEDNLWFSVCGVDTSRTISVYPLADNNTADVSGGAGGATLGVCSANNNVASLNPSAFTISTADDWLAITAAVRPAAAVERVPRFTPYPQLLAH